MASGDITAAAAAWDAIGLAASMPTFETWAQEMRERAASGKAHRTELVAMDAAFLAAADGSSEQVALAKQVEAAFKAEIDVLTKRARVAEQAFVKLLERFRGAPDPAPALAAGAVATKSLAAMSNENELQLGEVRRLRGQLDELGRENTRLLTDNGHLEAELAKLRNQDITIRTLEARMADMERAVEDTVALRLITREAELRRAFDAELETVRETEAALEARARALQAQLEASMAARDEAAAALSAAASSTSAAAAGTTAGGDGVGAQPSSLSGGGAGAAAAALESQVALLNDEVNALRSELRAKTMEAQSLSSKLASAYMLPIDPAGSGGTAAPPSTLSSDPFAALRAQAEAYRSRAQAAEAEAARSAEAAASLQQEVATWRAAVDTQRASFERAAADASRRLAESETELTAARDELARRPTREVVTELRQQVALLQAVTSGDVGDVLASTADGLPLPGDASGVQAALVRRCKQLEARAGERGNGRTCSFHGSAVRGRCRRRCCRSGGGVGGAGGAVGRHGSGRRSHDSRRRSHRPVWIRHRCWCRCWWCWRRGWLTIVCSGDGSCRRCRSCSFVRPTAAGGRCSRPGHTCSSCAISSASRGFAGTG